MVALRMIKEILILQKNWIGRSIGCEIHFEIVSGYKDYKPEKLEIFTTRPDTIYGATFIAVSVNHKIVSDNLDKDTIEDIKSNFASVNEEKEKLGVKLNINCKHPLLEKEIPIYVANFVLDTYGEGAIFGCPAHDERDFEFANKYSLPIIKVIECEDHELPYTGDGKVINSEI